MSLSRRRFARTATLSLSAASLAPAQSAVRFLHGVASGDPLLDRVLLWTRITPAEPAPTLLPVEWSLSRSPTMDPILQRGLTSTSAAFDFTVKVDAARLEPGTTYYYQFASANALSPIGRTRTLPLGATPRLRLALAACANLPYGYFHAYRHIAAQPDLDAVIHVGDYFYEYANSAYGDGTALGRVPIPDKELITLSDYRQRYAQYRTDPDLQEAHRLHPWIIVYDDHETANNSYTDGAENHNPATEGPWSVRRAVALQAWNEWLPVREQPFLDGNIYRTFRFGSLATLIMLDARLAGRSAQLPASSPQLNDPSRSILGHHQEQWLQRELAASVEHGALWHMIGQQVMMGQLRNTDGSPLNTDQWDGYPASRERLLRFIEANAIPNVVVLSGDIHSSWANEIAIDPFQPNAAPLAVEFVAPGITSPGIVEGTQAGILQRFVEATHPHVKYVNLFRRGYTLIDADESRIQAQWFHVVSLTTPQPDMELARTLITRAGSRRITPA